MSSTSIGEKNPFMELKGGSEANNHDPIYIAYDREGKHFRENKYFIEKKRFELMNIARVKY